MGQAITVTGIVLSAMPISDFDKRLVILTKELGKITAFAKGARRQNSALLAAANPFAFGEFNLYAGRNSYSVMQADIKNYFLEITEQFERTCFGFYFLEFTDYFTREGNEESEMLKLLYVTLRALVNDQIPKKLIRYIFELKAIVINGEYPQVFCCTCCGEKKTGGYFSHRRRGLVCENCRTEVRDARKISEACLYALQFIISVSYEKLYSFTVKESVLKEIEEIMVRYTPSIVDKKFKSLELLREL